MLSFFSPFLGHFLNEMFFMISDILFIADSGENQTGKLCSPLL